MRFALLTLILSIPGLASAQSSMDQSKSLTVTRIELTSAFAKAQAQLKAKEVAAQTAGAKALAELAPSIEALRDSLVQANQSVISGFNTQPYFHGAYDPSSTIISSLTKLMNDNKQLSGISLPTNAPFSPQDINAFQQSLDKIKRGIDEHSHAAKNHATTLSQRMRKNVPPAKKPATLPN